MVEETSDIKKVSSKPWKADNESQEWICWGREFQMPNGRCSKEKRSAAHFWSDIRYNEEILVGARIYKIAWRNVGKGAIKSQKLCWLLELKNFESKCGNLEFNTGRTSCHVCWGGGGKSKCTIIIISHFIFPHFLYIYIISLPILFNPGGIQGAWGVYPPNSAWKQLLPFPLCRRHWNLNRHQVSLE